MYIINLRDLNVYRESYTDEILDVGPDKPFKTISEAIDFLEAYMEKSTVIRLSDNIFNISSPMKINLQFSLTIEGITMEQIQLMQLRD